MRSPKYSCILVHTLRDSSLQIEYQQLKQQLRIRRQTRDFFIAEGILTDTLDVQIAEIQVKIDGVGDAVS